MAVFIFGCQLGPVRWNRPIHSTYTFCNKKTDWLHLVPQALMAAFLLCFPSMVPKVSCINFLQGGFLEVLLKPMMVSSKVYFEVVHRVSDKGFRRCPWTGRIIPLSKWSIPLVRSPFPIPRITPGMLALMSTVRCSVYPQSRSVSSAFHGFATWRFPKIGLPPNHRHFHGIFLEINHTATLGYPQDYGNPHIWTFWTATHCADLEVTSATGPS